MTRKTINLALQGGGAHGAFTWGALDRLLEEERVEVEGITATSAGAMNAAAFKCGWVQNGRDGAKDCLDRFWHAVSGRAHIGDNPIDTWLNTVMPAPAVFSNLVEMSPGYLTGEALSRVFSPYELNPLNLHPLRPIVTEMLDFDRVCAEPGPRLFISATNVRSGKIKVFSGDQVTPDAILASACLPTIYQAVEIEGEAYWDGGFMGNPALFPLFYETASSDILIVHINPIERPQVPVSAKDIANRINEISFNSSLLRELRSIDFVSRLIETGQVKRGDMKDVLIHSVMDDDLMRSLSVATKLTPDHTLLERLRAAGRDRMDAFLLAHWDDLGTRSSVDLRTMFE